jgi:hypothetical protein
MLHPFSAMLSCVLLLAIPQRAATATWSQVTRAPSGAGTMLLLTDGTIMIEASDSQSWMRLTPDAQGSYISGSWSQNPISRMSTPRLYFASQVLTSGQVWVLGGEYSGAGIPENTTGTGEIYDPVLNTWSAIADYPSQSNCPKTKEFTGYLTSGSNIVTGLTSALSYQVGWGVTGTGIPSNTTILSVDSPSQVHISQNATETEGVALSFTAHSTGNTSNGSETISGIPSTAGFQAGWPVSGTGIPAASTIKSVDSATQIHISQVATATNSSVALTFTVETPPAFCFGDVPSILLPGEQILAGNLELPTTNIYDVASNTWAAGSTKVYDDRSNEEGWVKLADGSILTYDIFQSVTQGSGYAERYSFDPNNYGWYGISPIDGSANGYLPVLSSAAIGHELGPVIRLQDDRIFVIGANGLTALYTPSTNTWAQGPDITGLLGGNAFPFAADDAPCAILPNGQVVFTADAGLGISSTGNTTSGSTIITGIPSTSGFQAGWPVTGTGISADTTIASVDSSSQIHVNQSATATGSGVALKFGGTFSAPTQFFVFDPSTNTIGSISPTVPDTRLNSIGSYQTRMLMLPTGEMLFADGSAQLWVYTPDGAASQSLIPVVTQVSGPSGGVYTLSGTQLNGQSAGSSYGDDVQNDENYPIVRLETATGNVYYARTTNWSYTGVAGGTTTESVAFTLNSATPAGAYSLIVTGAGLASSPFQVSIGSQTIAFGSLADQAYGVAPFSISATASSGLPVSFITQTPGVCTVTGATVSIAGVGPCTIQAMQGGNTTYLPAPAVDQSFQVSQEGQTITNVPSIGSLPLSEPAFPIDASATSGLSITVSSLTTGVCTVAVSIVTLVELGTCTIQLTQGGNTDYAAATPVKVSFLVTPSPCDVNQDGSTNIVDLQLIVNEALGTAPAVNSLSGSNTVDVVDVQIVGNAVRGLGCAAS